MIPCKELDAEELARCYLQVYGRYEAVQEIKTDNAKVFTSELITQFVELIQSTCNHSIAHRHCSNGTIEHANREIIRHIRCITNELKMDSKWSRFVMIAQRIMNATVNSITKVSPSQLLYGNMVTLDRNIFKSYKLKEDKTVHVYLKELLEVHQTLVHAS